MRDMGRRQQRRDSYGSRERREPMERRKRVDVTPIPAVDKTQKKAVQWQWPWQPYVASGYERNKSRNASFSASHHGNGRHGIALGLVVIIVALLFFGAFMLLNLMRGANTQIEYADGHLRALTIAESAVQSLISRMMQEPWEDRWFKDGGDFRGTPVRLFGGDFAYIIQDCPDRPQTADIWVRARYRRTQRVVFYRVRYQDLLFKGLTSSDQEFTSTIEADSGSKLTPGALDALQAKVAQLMARKSRTQGATAEAWDRLAGTVNPAVILEELGAKMADGVVVSQSLTEDGRTESVQTRPTTPVSADSSSIAVNYDAETLYSWISRQNFEAELASALVNMARGVFNTVDGLVDRCEFLKAEARLKAMLLKIYKTAGIVNLQIVLAKEIYTNDLRNLQAQADSEGWLPEQLAESRSALTSAWQQQRIQIIRDAGF